LHPGEHEPIVEAQTFYRVQALLNHNGRTGGVLVRNKYGALLKGLLFCKACGRAMTHTFTTKGPKRYRYYVCTRAIHNGRRACSSPSLPAAEIERVVVDQIREITTDRRLRAEVVRQAQEQADAQLHEFALEQRGLKRELAAHHAELQRLAAKGETTLDVAARQTELHELIAQTETRLEQLGHQIDGHHGDRPDCKQVRAALADFDKLWQALTRREQARLLSLLVARVEYDAEQSTICMSFYPTAIKSLVRQHQEKDA